MPGNPERSESSSGDAGQHSNLLLVIGCLLPMLAILIGVGSLLVHYAIESPVSPYQVRFSTSGKACSKDDSEDAALNLDQDTGEVLYCSVLPPMGVNVRPVGAFSAEEVSRVAVLSEALASENGFSDADRRAVQELVAQISRENGHNKMAPTLLEQLTWNVGLFSLIGGLVVLIGLGLWGHYKESRADPPAS